MSLRETIEAAKREAEEAGSIFVGSGREKGKSEEGAEQESEGFSRRSAARAKPKTAAASTVRVVSAEDAKQGRTGKKSSEMSKEERRAERERQRDIDDRRNTAANILLKNDEEYSRIQTFWWAAVILGLVMTIASFGINWGLANGMIPEDAAVAISGVAIAALVLAYVSIIGAFIYDLVKGRPIRNRVDAEVKGMSRKRLENIIRADAEERAAKKAK